MNRGIISATEQIGRTARAYDAVAKAYAEAWFDDPVMETRLSRFLDLLPSPGIVLDAGCGPGRDIRLIAKRGIEAVGIDISRGMIAEARTRVPEGIFRRMDLRSIAFPPESFDGVWACGTLQFLPSTALSVALSELNRILKTGGLFYVMVKEGNGEYIDRGGYYEKFYALPNIERVLYNAGFEILEVQRDVGAKSNQGGTNNWLNILANKPMSPSKSEIGEADCMFCSGSRFALQTEVGMPGISSILWSNDDLFVAPDISPLSNGHLLITTLNHYDCLGEMPVRFDPAMEYTRGMIRRLFKTVYGQNTLFFEHGSAMHNGPRAGACINHTHLHCLPLSQPIRRTVQRFVGEGQRGNIDTMRCMYQSQQSYLYLEEYDDGYVYPVNDIPSQFLRGMIGSLLGVENWKWHLSYESERSMSIFRQILVDLIPQFDDLNDTTVYGI